MDKLQASLKEIKAEQMCKNSEAQRYKDLYETEQKLRTRPSSRHVAGSEQSNKMQVYIE